MGWQEYPENDENCLPLTEDELKEFQIKSEQVCLTAYSFSIILFCNSRVETSENIDYNKLMRSKLNNLALVHLRTIHF